MISVCGGLLKHALIKSMKLDICVCLFNDDDGNKYSGQWIGDDDYDDYDDDAEDEHVWKENVERLTVTNEKAYDGDYYKKEENHYDVHDDHDECDYDDDDKDEND